MTYYAYIRVSTVRQGQEGVSLQEQRAAITSYAAREGCVISAWFEEQQTAAKAGRPIFNHMLSLLKESRDTGVILLKVDRGARNLRDWADMGELIDAGIDVRIAGESLDLRTRGGRLSADIQAVIAADYIRALREETRRGFYGRIKQGLFPLPAPLGYEDNGRGKAKTVHAVNGPLVRSTFDFYATGNQTLKATCRNAAAIGLRNRNGNPVTLNGISRLLRNPFYIGRIRIHGNKAIVPGRHEPLISEALFNRVQQLLASRKHGSKNQHRFLFTGMISCACSRHMYGELQKGHTYYRCHNEFCLEPSSIRQESVEAAVLEKVIHLFTGEHMIVVGWRRAEPFQKRMLLEHLCVKISVRKKEAQVSTPGDDFELPTWQSHLSQILNEILLQPAISLSFTRQLPASNGLK